MVMNFYLSPIKYIILQWPKEVGRKDEYHITKFGNVKISGSKDDGGQ